MEDYKSNSHKSKEEVTSADRKKVEPVVKGKTVKKSNNVRKFTDVFVSEDVSNVKDYVLMDVLVPAVKKAISDIVTNGIEMILYGETSGRKTSSSSNNISYRSYYDDRRDDRRSSYRSGTGYNYDDIKFESRIDAEEVLNRMDELIDRYGVVTVADMYDLARMSCNYTDNKYGWTSLRTAEINRVRDGYIIKLPRAVPIE